MKEAGEMPPLSQPQQFKKEFAVTSGNTAHGRHSQTAPRALGQGAGGVRMGSMATRAPKSLAQRQENEENIPSDKRKKG